MSFLRWSSGLLAVAALSLLGAAPAVALVSTPVGSGTLGLAVVGEPLDVSHDAGDEGLGDDEVTVREGVRELELRWDGAPLGGSASAGLRGLALRHGATPLAADALDGLAAEYPAGAGAAWLELSEEGAEPFLLGASVFGEPVPVWTTSWPILGWGVAYDGVVLPSSIARSTDYLIGNTHHQVVWHACWGLEEQTGLQLAGCDGPETPVLDAIPNVVLMAELQRATVSLVAAAAGAAHGAMPGQPPELAPGSLPASGAEAAALGPLAGMPPAQALGAGPAPAPAAGAAGPARAAGPHGMAASAVPLSLALPLLLGMAALLAPAWALYRRILPNRALAHPMRERILAAVRARPGIHESDLARELGLRHNHVQYHLRILEDAGILETRPFGGLKCIFELGRLSPAEKAVAMAQRGRSHEVLQAVSGEPGISQRGIAQRLGMSESSVKWHLDRLEGSGVVRTERARGVKRAWPALGLLPAPPAPAPAAGLAQGSAPPAA